MAEQTAIISQGAGAIESVSGQAPLSLPRDHKFHGGGIYDSGFIEEWHYWTGFFTDDETGEEFALFYTIFREGVEPGTVRHRVLSSISNLKTHELVRLAQPLADIVADVPSGLNSANDFQYTFGTSDDQIFAQTSYQAALETWKIKFRAVASSPVVRYELDLTLITQAPFNYLTVTPTGLENENTPWTGQADVETMSSISYYYAAPKMATKGTVTLDGRVRHLTGSMWLEHQWGNFEFSKCPRAATYIWSAFQFDDGAIFTFRQWLDAQAESLLNLGRHSYSQPNGKTDYGFGAATVWEGLKTWKSPQSGNVFPTSGCVTTPHGKFYYTPVFNEYEIPLGDGTSLWEGPIWIRQDSLEGPIIGRAFLELPPGLTKNFPEMP